MNKILNDILSILDKKTELLKKVSVLIDKINVEISPEELEQIILEMKNNFNNIKNLDEQFSKIETTYKEYIISNGFEDIIKHKYSEHEKLANIILKKSRTKNEQLIKEKSKLGNKIKNINKKMQNLNKFNLKKSNPRFFEEEI